MNTLVLLFACLFVVASALRTAPALPDTFHARIHATYVDKLGDLWTGGAGLLCVDVPAGFARRDINLFGDYNEYQNFHTLDRYDVGYSYELDVINHGCAKTRVNGKLKHPYAWVTKATFLGESIFQDQLVEDFEYATASTVQKISFKKGTNEPVVINTIEKSSSGQTDLKLVITSWSSEPSQEWARYIPNHCVNAEIVGDANSAVYFANNNWDCADVACDQTVPAGTGQPNYGCAEFVARSLAYGTLIPNIAATANSSEFYGYNYNGNSYDLCWTTSLASCLGALGFTKLAASYSSVGVATACFGDGGDGAWSHAVIGIGGGNVDAHNNARYQVACSWDLYVAIDAAYGPPGTPSNTGTSGQSSYYATQDEINNNNNVFGGEKDPNVYQKDENEDSTRLVEEKISSKF